MRDFHPILTNPEVVDIGVRKVERNLSMEIFSSYIHQKMIKMANSKELLEERQPFALLKFVPCQVGMDSRNRQQLSPLVIAACHANQFQGA